MILYIFDNNNYYRMRIIIRKGRKEGREEVRFPLTYKT